MRVPKHLSTLQSSPLASAIAAALMIAPCWYGYWHATASAAPLSPTAALPAPETNGVSLGGALERGWAPPFDAVERDQESAALTVHWSPAPAASLRLHYEVLTARWPDGTSASGSGDIRLGAAGRIWDGAPHPALPEVWVDWSAKLPNAPDEQLVRGLGTDETDVTAGGALRWALAPEGTGPLTILVSGSLMILGNPQMFANQDDAARIAWLADIELGPIAPLVRGEARLLSPRNPADILTAAGAEWRAPAGWRAGAEARLGLTPAAADFGAAVWFGRSWTRP